jgi:putative transcriptional regulator
MTQQALADRVGLTRQTIVAIEKGHYAPSLEAAFRIARVFGATIEEAYGFADESDVSADETADRPRPSRASKA